MKFPIYQIDAFTDQVFSGNPAAVVPLERWLPDADLQAIAAENNLSETAYFVPESDGQTGFHLRWFTPTNEVDLCGHATLAAAWVLFNKLHYPASSISFRCQAGVISVAKFNDMLQMDFPARPARDIPLDPKVLSALGIQSAAAMLQSRDLLVVLETEEQLARLNPDFNALGALDYFGVCVTAPRTAAQANANEQDSADFVSRFFAPQQGVNEDPVTGSAHCTLVPYWAQRLGNATLIAHQISPRGGVLHCQTDGERVKISGRACCYLEGNINLP